MGYTGGFFVDNEQADITIDRKDTIDETRVVIEVRSGNLEYTGDVFVLSLYDEVGHATEDSVVKIHGNVDQIVWSGLTGVEGNAKPYKGSLFVSGTIASGDESGAIQVDLDSYNIGNDLGTIDLNLPVNHFKKTTTSDDLSEIIHQGELVETPGVVEIEPIEITRDDIEYIGFSGSYYDSEERWEVYVRLT